MGEVARAAGCSRATIYRNVSDRREPQFADVPREARRIGALVTRETASVEGREARLVTADIVASSEVLDSLGFVDGPLAARWLRGWWCRCC